MGPFIQSPSGRDSFRAVISRSKVGGEESCFRHVVGGGPGPTKAVSELEQVIRESRETANYRAHTREGDGATGNDRLHFLLAQEGHSTWGT